MGFEVRVDIAGAVEIVRAAVGFEWRWGAADVGGFARRMGWSTPLPVGTFRSGAVFARTGLQVWWDSALFWGSERGLDYVRMPISDCPSRSVFAGDELLADAMARVTAAFTERWGEPESTDAGPAEGVAWRFPNLFAGLTIGADTVDLLLVAPAQQRYWMDMRHEAARRRTALGGWGRLTEQLAGFLDGLPVEARLVLTAPGGRYLQFTAEAERLHCELSRSEFIDPTWRYGAETEQELIDRGWTAAPDANWWRALTRGSGSIALSILARQTTDALRLLGVTAATELVADAWVEGGDDLDITALGIPEHPTARGQRAEFLRHHTAVEADAEPLRIDVPGGVEIARAARDFAWTWTRADVAAFLEVTGWKPVHDPREGEREVWADTDVRVEGPRARFSFDGDRLESVCVTLSDSIESFLYDEGLPAEVREQRTAAFTRAIDGFRSEFGTPVHAALWHAHGPVWPSPRLSLGLVADADTVDLHLVNPAERERRLIIEQQQAAHRARDREWGQFFDDLAGLAADLTAAGQLTVDGGADNRARIDLDGETVRLELSSATARQLSPRVLRFMLRDGWLAPDSRYPLWRIILPLPALPRDYRFLAQLSVWPLRARMGPGVPLRVRLDGVEQPLRFPSTGAVRL
ncbi:DUF6301 family protein [Nocardia sp. NPDC088792]|uniref:DUF6301 family protein n=1 Tax=Nocardia sp. NPDC088792 TaxID=3364332 RepID=UPI0038039266